MSILADKLKLEVISIYDSNLAQFISTDKSANLYIVPKDSSTHYTIISSQSQQSNIETSIILHSENADIKAFMFDNNSINFGNDTLLKGNLVVYGSIIALGYDVLTEENTFVLNNYGSSAQNGLNSTTQKTLNYMNNRIANISNNIINYMTIDLDRMDKILGISNLTSIPTNTFTKNDFNNLFAIRTLDDLQQGTSNRFIINNVYNPYLPQSNYTVTNPAIIQGTVVQSNLIAKNVYVEEIYANEFYGNGENIININPYFFNTNFFHETLLSSNIYFTYDRVNEIAYSSNLHASNCIISRYIECSNIMIKEDANISNLYLIFMNDISNLIIVQWQSYTDLFNQERRLVKDTYSYDTIQYQYFASNSNNIILLYNDKLLTQSNYIYTSIQNVEQYVFEKINDIQYKIFETSNQLYINLEDINITNHNILSNAFDNLYKISVNSNNIASNAINNVISSYSNLNISNIIQDISIILNMHHDDIIEKYEDFTLFNSNNNIIEINKQYKDLDHFLQTTSNDISSQSFAINNILLSYYTETSNNLHNSFSLSLSNINIEIGNLYDYKTQIIRNIYEYSNILNDSIGIIITDNSNNTIKDVSDFIANNIETGISSILKNIVHNINTDVVIEQSNKYFSQDNFNSSILRKNLNEIKEGHSNKVIVDDTYNTDLIIDGNITVQNVIIQGNNAIFNTPVYSTEKVEICNYSNMAAAIMNNFAVNTDVMKLNQIFNLKNNGKIGINNSNPDSTLDVKGTVKAKQYYGIGDEITNVNLADKTTADLQEGSNLYYSDSRVTSALYTSNIETSNVIKNKVQDVLSKYMIYTMNNSNFNDNISKKILSVIQDKDLQTSNYIHNFSNSLDIKLIKENLDQSNYVDSIYINISNSLDEILLNQSNYTSYNIEKINNKIIENNEDISNMIIKDYELINNSNYIEDNSNIILSYIDIITYNHSNIIDNLFNYHYNNLMQYANDSSNFVINSSNNMNNKIKNMGYYYSNIADITGNNLERIVEYNISNLLITYKEGGTYMDMNTYDPNIIHLNFKDRKILNRVDTDSYKVLANGSNLLHIYPVINNFMTKDNAFLSSSNIYVYVSEEYEVNKVLNAINNTFTIHSIFSYTIHDASIIYIGNFQEHQLHVKVIGDKICIVVKDDVFYTYNSIMKDTWYVIDVIFDVIKEVNNIEIQLYIDKIQQDVVNTKTSFISKMHNIILGDNFTHNRGSNNRIYIGAFNSSGMLMKDLRMYVEKKQTIISNIPLLYDGMIMSEYTISSNVVIQPIRWQESQSYASNYFNPLNRYITYNGGEVYVGIGNYNILNATLDIHTDDPTMYSIKTNNTIWVQSSIISSSDERIKTNIRDFDDEMAIQQIANIEPKMYEYIHRDKSDIYGFSAQQIRKVIPNAVSLQEGVIPNINSIGRLTNNTIYLLNFEIILKIDDEIVIYYNGDVFYENVISVINNRLFKIENRNKIENGIIYIYGTKVGDFHSLDKNYLYTLSVCATQALYKKQEELSYDISSNIGKSNLNYTREIEELLVRSDSIADELIGIRQSIENMDDMIMKLENINNSLNRYTEQELIYMSICNNNITNEVSIMDDYNHKIFKICSNILVENHILNDINDIYVDLNKIEDIFKMNKII
jgi:hypothetical protein